jgi:hypothetical protein
MTLLKILFGALAIKQSDAMIKAVKPVLKEYTDAEAGRSSGVVMSERRSKKTNELKKTIKNITALTILLTAIAIAYCNSWMQD